MKKRATRNHYTNEQKSQVVLEMLREEQTVSQIATKHGVHTTMLHKWKAQALEHLPSAFDSENQTVRTLEVEHDRERQELYAEIGRLTTQLAGSKKNLASTLKRNERQAMIEQPNPELSLATQAELLSLNRSSLYYVPVSPTPDELYLKRRIDEIFTKYPFYGSRKIQAVLRQERPINRKAVQRHMREMGLAAIYPGPNLSKRAREHPVFPYLLRHLTVTNPNHVWGIDITYIRLRGGWLYLVAVLDWFSRYVLSWELDQTLEMPFILTAVQTALEIAVPRIWNSDQGSHFTSPQYIERLQAAHVQISMDGRGRALDNIFVERLWRTVKYEEVYLKDYDSPREARLSLAHYFQYYNTERPHQSLGYRTPAQVYFADKASLN